MRLVLDAWAVMALLGDEPSAERVERAIDEHECIVSSVNLGEALYQLERRRGARRALRAVDAVRTLVQCTVPDWPTTVAAAHVKAGGGLSYADAFCIATAQRLRAPLWTGDPELLARGDAVDVVDLRDPS